MKKQLKQIESFRIDHTRLKQGLYLSRIDAGVYTYDLRVCLPNKERMDGAAAHTAEHIIATYLRNEYTGIIYFGPMGCMTGFYLLCLESDGDKVKDMVLSAFSFLADYNGDIVGATEKECGNYRYHNLNEAKNLAKRYIRVLSGVTCYSYEVAPLE